MTTQSLRATGRILTLTAPYARATSGLGALIGAIFGVSCDAVASGAAGQFDTEGVHYLDKTSAQAWTAGQKLAWDDTNKRLDSDLSKGPVVGTATVVAANPSSKGYVQLEVPPPRANVIDTEGSAAPTSDVTAGARTYTAAEILSGIIVRDCGGASRSDVLPTAALLVAAVPQAKVGDLLKVQIINGSDAAEVITLNAGTGGAFDANQTAASRVIGQNTSKTVCIRLTNVTAAAEAYVAYA